MLRMCARARTCKETSRKENKQIRDKYINKIFNSISLFSFLPFVSFAFAHALRARKRSIYATPELYISAHGNTLRHNNIYCIKTLLNLFIKI